MGVFGRERMGNKPVNEDVLAWTTGFIGRVSDDTDHELQNIGLT